MPGIATVRMAWPPLWMIEFPQNVWRAKPAISRETARLRQRHGKFLSRCRGLPAAHNAQEGFCATRLTCVGYDAIRSVCLAFCNNHSDRSSSASV